MDTTYFNNSTHPVKTTKAISARKTFIYLFRKKWKQGIYYPISVFVTFYNVGADCDLVSGTFEWHLKCQLAKEKR